MKKVALGLILVFAILASLVANPGYKSVNAAGENWLTGWANRVELAIDSSKIDSNLSDFPILIHLSSSSGIGSKDVSSVFDALGNDANRKKIAVTMADGITQSYVEIEYWSAAAKEAFLWVKVPSISSTVNTTLYLYYDNTQADNNAHVGDKRSVAAEQVWTNGFVAVYHMDEILTGVSGELKDSTSNHHDGRGSNPPTRVWTKTGYGQQFNGSGNFIEIPDHNDFSINTTRQLNISLWASPAVINMSSSSSWTALLAKGWYDTGVEYHIIYYPLDSYRPQWFSFYVYNPEGGAGAGGGGHMGSLAVNQWRFLSAKTDMVRSYMNYDDRLSPISDGWAGYPINRYANGRGAVLLGTMGYGGQGWWNGRVEEVRFSNIMRSNAWDKADYYSGNDNLVTFGSVGVNSGPSPTPTPTPIPSPTPSPTPTPIPEPSEPSNTFGLNSGDSVAASTAWLNAQRFQNTVGNGVLTKLELQVSDTSVTGNIKLGVYADNNGTPGNLLLDGGEVLLADGWVSKDGLSLPVAANAYYWLTFLPQNPTDIRYQSAGQPAGSHQFYPASYGALPLAFSVSTSLVNNTPYVVRATVTPATETPTPTPEPTPAPAPEPTQPPATPPAIATFGLNSGDGTSNQRANALQAMRFLNTAGTGSLSKLEVLVDDDVTSGKIRIGVYADNNGRPGALLLDAGEVAVTNGWVSIGNLKLSLTQNMYYWLAFNLEKNNKIRSQSKQAFDSHFRVNNIDFGSLPAYFAGGLIGNDSQYVMRANVSFP